MSVNKVILIGNLGKKPELRYTPQGIAVCSFTLATTDKKNGEKVTQWWKCTTWRQTAEAADKYLDKGSKVYVEGKLGIEEWTDREGKGRYTLDVQVTDLQFIDTRSEDKGEAVAVYQQPTDIKSHLMSRQAEDDTSIPF